MWEQVKGDNLSFILIESRRHQGLIYNPLQKKKLVQISDLLMMEEDDILDIYKLLFLHIYV